MKTLLCIDGNSILNRAFYGIRLLTNKAGFPTNALYGLTNIVSRQMEALKPDYAAIAYDLHAPTFRHRMYADYKAGRHAMPDELRAQMPVSRDFAEMLGLHVLSLEGYEADDILGTLSRMAGESPEDCTAYLLTGDKDSLQLIGPHTHVLLAGNNETKDMDEAAFIERYGVRPDQFVDVKAIMGDSSDHIPGVPGIGEKGPSSSYPNTARLTACTGSFRQPPIRRPCDANWRKGRKAPSSHARSPRSAARSRSASRLSR